MKIIVMIYVFLLCSLQQIRNLTDYSSLIINLDTSKKETELFASTLFNSPKTIILETSKDCLIGTVADIQVYDGKIFISDEKSAKALYIFDMDGKFIRKIGGNGRGPGEYLRLMDFTIDKINHELYLLDGNNKLHRYKVDGTYLNSITIEIEYASIRSVQFCKDMIYAEILPWKNNIDDIDLLWRINPVTGKKKDSFMKTSQYIYGWDEMLSLGYKHFFGRLEDSPIYAHYLMNTVVLLDDMSPKIKLESEYLLLKSDIDEIFRNKEIQEKVDKLLNMNRIFGVQSYIENKRFVFFSYCGSHKKCGSVFHDFSTNKTLHLTCLKNDFLWKEEAWMTKFSFYDSFGAYQILDAEDIFEEIGKKNLANHIDKKEQLDLLNEESNPVIFYYEFKDAE